MKRINCLVLSSLTAAFLVGCGGGGGSSSSPTTSTATPVTTSTVTPVTIERGPLLGATVKDANGTAPISINGNVYTFSTVPVYPITATGGYIDLDADGLITTADVAFTGVLKSYSNVITPITTYIATGTTDAERIAKLAELKAKLTGTVSDDDLLKKVPSETSGDIIALTNAIYDSYSVLFDADTTNDDITSVTTLDKDLETYRSTITKSGTGLTPKQLAKLVEEDLMNLNGISKLTENEVNEHNHPTTETPTTPTDTTTTSFVSGDSFKGLVYNVITSPTTGKQWLDRNLGASQACTSSTDSACYGDYYQWGRLADGHEKSNSTITTTQASTISSVGNQFVTEKYDWTTADADGSQRSALWNKTDGTGVCPVGFRVPTFVELSAEEITNSTDAFSKLKFPVAGARFFGNGSVDGKGVWGDVWTSSSSVNETKSYYMYFEDDSDLDVEYRTDGRSVRCIKGN